MQFDQLRRREFITLLGGASTLAFPLAARAQQVKRIGVLMGSFEVDDPLAEPEVRVLREELLKLGWREGRNLRTEYRWGAGDIGRIQAGAKELVDLGSDLIVSRATPATREAIRATRTIPILFVQVSDPVGDGFVKGFARPGGNATGFTNIEATITGKWVELLKEVIPGLRQVVLMYNPQTAPGRGMFFADPFEKIATSLKVKAVLSPVSTPSDIESTLLTISPDAGGALIINPGAYLVANRDLIFRLVTQRRIPTIYPFTFWVRDGGLMSYGTNTPDLFRRAAAYVDRILKGEKTGDLPVQAPTTFELVVNLKTAKALAIDIPATLLTRADEVIE